MLQADMTALVYEKCFILCAGLDYDLSDSSAPDMRHLTNLSINKAYPGHPGQVPCWLSKECPEVCLSGVLSEYFSLLVRSDLIHFCRVLAL